MGKNYGPYFIKSTYYLTHRNMRRFSICHVHCLMPVMINKRTTCDFDGMSTICHCFVLRISLHASRVGWVGER